MMKMAVEGRGVVERGGMDGRQFRPPRRRASPEDGDASGVGNKPLTSAGVLEGKAGGRGSLTQEISAMRLGAVEPPGRSAQQRSIAEQTAVPHVERGGQVQLGQAVRSYMRSRRSAEYSPRADLLAGAGLGGVERRRRR